MCGICGVFGQGDLNHQQDNIKIMAEKLQHRGPDSTGYHIQNSVCLGFQRLAIIDLDGGNQPMHSVDGRYSMIFNGEIYNYLELRQSLIRKGIEFHTFSDSEVLLQMLIHHGADALNQLNGMFAFAFFDHHTEEWLLARDQVGIKPLYYAQVDDTVLFASEIKAILAHPSIKTQVNNFALSEYLTFQFCLGDHTLFAGVKKLEPAHYIRGRQNEILEITEYFSISYEVDDYHTEDYFIDRLRYLIEDSVRLQTRSDVPIGAYLSGGIDSSYVTSIATDILNGLQAFHGRFEESSHYDESPYAQDVAANAGANLRMMTPTAQQFADLMPHIIYMMDEPVAGPGVFPQYCVSRFARNDVTVVLGGQGGDEIFGGYARYLVAYLEQALKGAIYQTQEEGKYIVTLESIVPNLALLQKYQPLLQHFWGRGLFEPMDSRYFHLIDRSPDINSLLTNDAQGLINREATFAAFQSIFNRPDTQSYINKMTNFDMKTLLPALLHVEDRVSMAVSLESRVPLLDTRIIELVAKMPPSLKFSAGRSKYILKQVARTRLPDSVMNRQDKMGFPVPLKEWIGREPVRGFIHETLLGKSSRERGLFEPKALEKLIATEGRFGRQLWGALCLELWHQQFIDSA